jgi:hypothetical protein
MQDMVKYFEVVVVLCCQTLADGKCRFQINYSELQVLQKFFELQAFRCRPILTTSQDLKQFTFLALGLQLQWSLNIDSS